MSADALRGVLKLLNVNDMKTHFAILEHPANESFNQDEWSSTWCGLDEIESPLTDNEKYVTCKNCQNALKKYPFEQFIKDSCNF